MKSVEKFRTLPQGSIMEGMFERTDYCDSFRIPLTAGMSIDELTYRVFQSPRWVNGLMKLRDSLVRIFGLKTDPGNAPQPGYHEVGSKAPFTVQDRNENEIVMGEEDKHLDFKVSVLADRQNAHAYVTTIVQFHNGFGRFYFTVIRPFHGVIVKSLIKQVIQSTEN